MEDLRYDAETVPVRRLRAAVRGEVIVPSDPGYDAARAVFYSAFDRRPGAIVKAVDATDIGRVLSLVRETGVPLAVRGGGHSPAGYSVCDGGIVLDLSALRALDIDVDQRTAWAGAGLTAGEYTSAVGEYGLATGFGDAASVGIGGITLCGGVGYLHRKYGLTIDSLLAAEVVTADGQLLRADPDTHPDLFWAVRGGGGNFGVATRLQYRLHDVDTAVGGMLILPGTLEVIESFVAAAVEAPAELSGIVNVMAAPPMPFLPAEHHGRVIVAAVLVHAGPVEAGERAIAPFRSLTTPIVDMIEPLRYRAIYDGGEPPRPAGMAVRSLFVDTFDRSTAETIAEHLEASSARLRVAQFRILGGAVADVPADATAFAHRRRQAMVTVAAGYERAEDPAEHEAWAARLADALHPDERGAYIGFLGADGPERIRDAYPDPTWERLRQIKAKYDPTNLFRLNHNVPPADDDLAVPSPGAEASPWRI